MNKKDRFIKELGEDISNTEPDWVHNIQDEIVNDLKPINKPFQGIESDIEDEADTLLEDVYPDAEDWLADNHDLVTYFSYFRWIVNFLFVGIPWVAVSVIMCILNIVFNTVFTGGWADGNFFLILNTAYLLIQTILSWPLVLEIPIFINDMRFFRALSVLAAWGYSFVYILTALDWAYMLWMEPESTYEEYDFMSVMTNMFLAFNLVGNIIVMPVNFAIIAKEVTLEIFPPLLDQDEGENLGINDFEETVRP